MRWPARSGRGASASECGAAGVAAASIAGYALIAGAAVALSAALTPNGTIENDVSYYHAWTRLVPHSGFDDVLREYPTPVMLMLWWLGLVAPSDAAYQAGFVVAAVVTSAAGVVVLTGLPGKGAGRAASSVFLACLGTLGPLTLYRFDLLPGLLLATACVVLARQAQRHAVPAADSEDAPVPPAPRPWWSVLIALGTGIKVWPIIAWPLVLGERTRRRREVAAFIATGTVLVTVSVATAGWGRLISPLTWQSGRGLHVESVLATWVLLARIVSPSSWNARLSDANSWDFSGPGVSATITLGALAQVALFTWIVAISLRLWRTRAAQPLAVSVAATSVVGVFLVTDKVFSPQYMMWLVPVAAVACGLGRGGGVPRWWAPVLVTTCALTQLSYPTIYGWLYAGNTGPLFLAGTLVMVARNLAVLALAVSSCRRAWYLAVPGAGSVRKLPAHGGGPGLVDRAALAESDSPRLPPTPIQEGTPHEP